MPCIIIQLNNCIAMLLCKLNKIGGSHIAVCAGVNNNTATA